MTGSIETLRPLTAGRLLTIRQAVRQETEDALERALLCNAEVLAGCCYTGGERVFEGRGAVLEELTCREMEDLLSRLARLREPERAGGENPAFDWERFQRMREGA